MYESRRAHRITNERKRDESILLPSLFIAKKMRLCPYDPHSIREKSNPATNRQKANKRQNASFEILLHRFSINRIFKESGSNFVPKFISLL